MKCRFYISSTDIDINLGKNAKNIWFNIGNRNVKIFIQVCKLG